MIAILLDVNDLIVDELTKALEELKDEISKQQPDPDYYAQAIDNKIEEIKR